MPKELYVFSDVELGGGTVTDDFASDGLLVDVIKKINDSKGEIDLIFNGDSFDFLKCPIVRKQFTFYLEHVTVNVALEKLGYIYKSHENIFNAWKEYLKDKKHKLFFLHGNHDYELLFPEVQEKIKSILESENVFFQEYYFENKVYVEHGHLRDTYFAYDPKIIFREYKGKKELNIPALFSGFSTFFMDSKEQNPFLERIEDRRNLFAIVPSFRAKMIYLVIKYYIHNLIFAIYNYIARGYLRTYFRIISVSAMNLFRKNYDVNPKELFKAVKELPKTAKIIVFGHVHEKVNEIQQSSNKRVIILDTWREEYSFSDNLKFLVPKTKRYAKIVIDDPLKVTLFDLSAKGGKILFEKVLEDEHKYSKKVFDDRNNISIDNFEIDETNFTIN